MVFPNEVEGSYPMIAGLRRRRHPSWQRPRRRSASSSQRQRRGRIGRRSGTGDVNGTEDVNGL